MDFTLREIITSLIGSGGIIAGLFVGIKWAYEQLDKRREGKLSVVDKAYEQVWKLYEAAQKEIAELEDEIAELKRGDSLSRPTVSKIYQAHRKLGKQIEILESIFVKEILIEGEKEELKTAIKTEMDILWQKFDELEKSLP